MSYGNDCNVEACDNSNDNEEYDNASVCHDENGYIKLQDLSMNQFRKKLIIHFHFAFTQNKIEWPKRNK